MLCKAALPGGTGAGDKVAQQESQKALPSQLPRHKKPDSSRGPDPFQIYIHSLAHGPPLQSDLGLRCFLSGQSGPSASLGAVLWSLARFSVDFPKPPQLLCLRPDPEAVVLSSVQDRAIF